MAAVSRERAAIESAGAQVAFVHMSPAAEADAWFEHYGVADLPRISDPDKRLYHQFELGEASLKTLAHPRVWGPWFRTAVLERFGVGRPGPNWRQLTGAFVIYQGRILGSIRHKDSAGRPDYVALLHALRLHATNR